MKQESEIKLMSRLPELLAAKEIRDKRRYSQKEIADAAGLSESMVSRFMKGDGVEGTAVGRVKRLANWLGCSIDDLIHEAEPA